MKLQAKIKAATWGGLAWLLVMACGATGVARGANLRELAARAEQRSAWPALRHWAESTPEREQRGQAFLVLGYREHAAGEFSAATEDLRRAVETEFSLGDVALYYQASAARDAGQPARAAEILDGFRAHYPQSPLRFDALALAARSWLDSTQPERAIQVLMPEPSTRRRPSLAVLLAQAYGDAKRPEEAARIFQEVYYAFPTSPESSSAESALPRLRAELGGAFPEVSEEIQTGRADLLARRSRLRDAVSEYEALLARRPASPLAPRWKVARARSLLRLQEPGQVIDSLAESFPQSPEYDAQRLATLVQAYLQKSDADAARLLLEQLRTVYATTPAYARALSSFGDYSVRQSDWTGAATFYQPLAQFFPQTDLGREAEWRLAWSHYLARDLGGAKAALAGYLPRHADSDHVPAALYWLGRIAEQESDPADAVAFYGALHRRFVHSYYASEAVSRLERLADRKGGPASEPSPATVALLASIPSRPSAPLPACGQNAPSDLLRPALALENLSLDELAETYLKGLVADRPDSLDLLLALSRVESGEGRPALALFSAKRAVPEASVYDFSELPEEVWRLLYPQAYWPLARQQARANRLSPYLVMALIRQESAFNPRALSVANARGLMQILPQTVSRSRRGRARAARRLLDPAYNVRFGTRHLRDLLKELQGDPAKAMAAYHAGLARVAEWVSKTNFQDSAEFVETIPIPSTRAYVEWVLRDAEIYRQLLTGQARFAKCR